MIIDKTVAYLRGRRGSRVSPHPEKNRFITLEEIIDELAKKDVYLF